MTEQYFARQPSTESRPVETDFEYRGHSLRFRTDSGVFSRGRVDEGSALLLEALPPLRGRVLDLGCGVGVIGVSCARAFPAEVTLSDVNRRALGLAEENLALNGVTGSVVESDGFTALTGAYDAIITNPPIRAGKAVIYRLFAEARDHLTEDGALYLVIRRQQGADSAEKYLRTLFAEVRMLKQKKGYRVFSCTGKEASADAVST